MHIFRHLFVCFQTSVYTLGEYHKNRNNSTVFEYELLINANYGRCCLPFAPPHYQLSSAERLLRCVE